MGEFKSRTKNFISLISNKYLDDKENIIKVKDVFYENKHHVFLNLCITNNINYVNEINNDLLIEYCSLYGTGTKKIQSIKNILKEIWSKENYYINFEYNPFNIDFIFSEIKFNKFRRYCKDKQLVTINDFTKEEIISFREIKSITNKLVEIINNKIDEENIIKFKDIEINALIDENKMFKINQYWLSKLKLARIKDIEKIFNIKESVINTNLLIKDINKITFYEDKNDKKIAINKLIDSINSVKSPKEIINGIESVLDDRYIFILNERYNKGKTLDSIGKIEGLTRERVRQLQRKANNKVISYLVSSHFLISLKLEFLEKEKITMEEFNDYFESTNLCYKKIIIEYLNNNIEEDKLIKI